MAESRVSSGMPETDIEPIKEALFAQQQLLQKLYTELDEEREASATAASETLSMILRLQGEKAAVKMEANQYKRLVEEKMCHAEESLAVFEDLIYQKEMEIASLEFQTQAYRYKLLSLGCGDLGDFENRFPDPENLLFQRNDHFTGQIGVNGNVRRINSLPPMLLKDSIQKKVISERERSGIPVSDMIPWIVEENESQEVNAHSLDLEKRSGNSAGGDFNSYWEQIRKLDEQVKEISHFKDSGRGTSANLKDGCRSSLLLSQVSTGTSLYPTTGEISTLLEQAKHSKNLWEREAVVSSAFCSSVHDVFEVPESKENRKVCECEKKEKSKLILQGEKRLRKPDSVLEETAESHVKDDADLVKQMLLCANHENKLSKPGDEKKVDCQLALAQPAPGVAEYQATIQQLGQRIERLERERNSERQEISDERAEGVKLLKEICKQLNSIQSEMRSRRSNKSPPPDESPLHSVMEAMLYFWL